MVTVDNLLGDHEQRYFGQGHKRTDYRIYDIKNENAFGEIIQKGTWSNKSEQNIQPHLSTLDGVILASLLAEEILIKNKNSLYLGNMYLSKFEIKSGMKPIEKLDQIPIRIKNYSIDEEQSSFNILVLDMKVTLIFKYLREGDFLETQYSPLAKEYISNHLKNIHHDIFDIHFNKTCENSISCQSNRIEKKEEIYKGVLSNTTSYYSILELLIIFSQMAEMLAYHVDNIDRECSETLWMKQVCIELVDPIMIGELSLSGKVIKDRLLDMKGQNWRIFEMSGSDIHQRVKASTKIAHQLPKKEVV